MKLSFTKNNVINIFFFLYIIILIWNFVNLIKNGYSKESWQITEFLINYEGGYVRRGLLGELILYLYNFFEIQPYSIILFISICAYLILIWFFVKSFINKGYTLFILPFVFFLGNPIQNDFWVRKDILLILIFILIIYFSLKKSNWNLILVNLFLIVGLLIHESIGLFCFPILFSICKSRSKKIYNNTFLKTISVSFIQLFPAIFVFLSVLYFKGTHEIASQIWASWKPINFPIQAKDNTLIPAAINGISWSVKQGLSLTIHTLKNFIDGIYAPMAWGLIILIIYYILTNTSRLNFKLLNYMPKRSINKINISSVLVFQLLTIIPLFILGWDYSRWIFYWVTSSFVIILLVPEEKINYLLPESILIISTKINSILEYYLKESFVLIFSLLIGFSACSWNLTDTINSNSIVIILKFISNLIFHVLYLVKGLV